MGLAENWVDGTSVSHENRLNNIHSPPTETERVRIGDCDVPVEFANFSLVTILGAKFSHAFVSRAEGLDWQ